MNWFEKGYFERYGKQLGLDPTCPSCGEPTEYKVFTKGFFTDFCSECEEKTRLLVIDLTDSEILLEPLEIELPPIRKREVFKTNNGKKYRVR